MLLALIPLFTSALAISYIPDAKAGNEFDCRDGEVLVLRLTNLKPICLDEDTAKRWEELGIGGPVGYFSADEIQQMLGVLSDEKIQEIIQQAIHLKASDDNMKHGMKGKHMMDGMMKHGMKPHHQKYAGISAQNVVCAEGKQLMFKHHNAKPACINSHSVDKLQQRGWQTEKPMIACTMEYDPVCGMDGVTYGNMCGLNAEHMAMKHKGECTESKITNFQQCMDAGNPVMESHPRQCRTQAGDHFTEEIHVFPHAISYTKQAPEIDPNTGYFVDEIADGLYWMFGDRYQVMFLTTGEGVIVVDAPMPIGEKYLDAIKQVTDEPITHMIYSHAHEDHTGAAGQIFPDDIEYIAYQKTADILIEEADPNRPIPTITFEDTYTLEVGNQILELSHIGPYHSAGDTIIYAPEHKVIMAVDLFHPGGAPYKAFGVTVNMDEHIKAHDTLVNDFDFEVMISGHMEILGTKEHIKTDKKFIHSVMHNIKTAMNELPEDQVIQSCVDNTIQQWTGKLIELDVFMADHCSAMHKYVMENPHAMDGHSCPCMEDGEMMCKMEDNMCD